MKTKLVGTTLGALCSVAMFAGSAYASCAPDAVSCALGISAGAAQTLSSTFDPVTGQYVDPIADQIETQGYILLDAEEDLENKIFKLADGPVDALPGSDAVDGVLYILVGNNLALIDESCYSPTPKCVWKAAKTVIRIQTKGVRAALGVGLIAGKHGLKTVTKFACLAAGLGGAAGWYSGTRDPVGAARAGVRSAANCYSFGIVPPR